MLVNAENVRFSYGGNLIFSEVTFALHEGERVGLIGANGEGKTTLIKLILGELHPDYGLITQKNAIKIGYLEQNGGYESGNTVYGEMLEIFKEQTAAIEKLNALSLRLSECEYGSKAFLDISSKIENLNFYIASHDSYNMEVKIKTVLNGMGFNGLYGQVVDTMSGGEKTRLKLARLLLEEPDLLILDEPTNHLDIPTLFWLEEYLSSFKGGILTVSHDRYFLDRLCNRMLEIENGKLLSFSGNYSKYKVLKAERNARLLKEYEAQVEERAKLQTYVDKNIVRATTAKSAQSRVKQLEKMQILEKPYTPPSAPKFTFTFEEQSYENVLEIKDLNLEIGEKQLICGGQLQIKRGEKVALTGENGTGKTTLLRQIIANKDRNISLGRFVKIAYYDQEGLNLNTQNTVLAELWERHVLYTQTEIRSALARAGLFEEDMQKPVSALSGGERAKLALCILESERGNFLILDEPTNHLDLPARESLERALQNFEGTLLFVSHDRYFISALAEKIVEIENRTLTTYDGGYEFFTSEKQKLAEAERQREEEIKNLQYKEKKNESYRSAKERALEVRKKERIKQIEADICAVEREEEQINSQLSNPEIASDYKKVGALLQNLEELKIRLDALYKEYEEVL